MKRVLITGGAGFIGINLIQHLLEFGYKPLVLDNLSVGKREHLDTFNVPLHIGDITHLETWEHLLEGIDIVVHLAAHTSVPGSISQPRHDFDMNVVGIFRLLSAAQKHKVKKFIFASSNAVVGHQTPPIREDMVPRPMTPYGASKLTGEAYCSAFYHAYGMHTVALRFANVYGPFSNHKESVVASFFKQALEKQSITIYGDGKQTRDFVYVTDLVHGIRLAIEHEVTAGHVIQLGSGLETMVITLAEYIQKFIPHTRIEFQPPRLGDIYRNFSDITKARRLMTYTPQINLDQGLRYTFENLSSNYKGMEV